MRKLFGLFVLLVILLPAFLKAQEKQTIKNIDDYIGNYQEKGNPSLKMWITKREGKLFGEGTGLVELEIVNQKEDTFEIDKRPVIITFKRDASKIVTGLEALWLNGNGVPRVFEKEKPKKDSETGKTK